MEYLGRVGESVGNRVKPGACFSAARMRVWIVLGLVLNATVIWSCNVAGAGTLGHLRRLAALSCGPKAVPKNQAPKCSNTIGARVACLVLDLSST